jgi:hypothetical protein
MFRLAAAGMTVALVRAESAPCYRFARKYQLGYSSRPVIWEELGERERTPQPGPQRFITTLSREVAGRRAAVVNRPGRGWPLAVLEAWYGERGPT